MLIRNEDENLKPDEDQIEAKIKAILDKQANDPVRHSSGSCAGSRAARAARPGLPWPW